MNADHHIHVQRVNYSGQPDLKVTNIIYLFIDGVVGGNITAYITTPTGVNHS